MDTECETDVYSYLIEQYINLLQETLVILTGRLYHITITEEHDE